MKPSGGSEPGPGGSETLVLPLWFQRHVSIHARGKPCPQTPPATRPSPKQKPRQGGGARWVMCVAIKRGCPARVSAEVDRSTKVISKPTTPTPSRTVGCPGTHRKATHRGRGLEVTNVMVASRLLVGVGDALDSARANAELSYFPGRPVSMTPPTLSASGAIQLAWPSSRSQAPRARSPH